MEQIEARLAAKSIYLISAALAGLDVSPGSPEPLADMVDKGFYEVDQKRKPEAVANLLRIVATALYQTQENGEDSLHEYSVPRAQEKVCPIYPFGDRSDLAGNAAAISDENG